MQITREFAKYQLVTFSFGVANLAADQTDVQIKDATGQVDGISMPFAGELVAISIDTTAAATAGELTVGATKDGTENASTTQTITTATAATQAFPRGTATFSAGDKIGVEISTTAAWDATTADLSVTLLCALAVAGI